MRYTEIKDKTAVELNAMLKEKKLLLFALKQKLRTMQLTSPKEISQAKKDTTKINTAISALR